MTLSYDTAGRLMEYGTVTSTRFYYAGSAMLAEVSNPSGTILRRYVPGPGTDEPVVWYEGSGTADRRWLHADERGSVIAVSDGSGAMLAINRYDEFGVPQSTNAGRFQYTGQAWLPELGMYYYKARIYSPTLGRFMQTDPIGYGDGMNWYNYVGGDPVNFTDPTGLDNCQNALRGGQGSSCSDIVVSHPPIDICQSVRVMCNPGFDYINSLRSYLSGGGAVFGGGGGTPQNNQSKPLPPCLQNFLKGRLKSNPADIRLHRGSPFELTGYSVTFGNDVYLAGDMYGRSDRGATIHKFHEIQHTSQYARGYSALNQAFAYPVFGGHDASPFEQAADKFANDTYRDYIAAGLDKTCPF